MFETYRRALVSHKHRKPHLNWQARLPDEREGVDVDEPPWFKAQSSFFNQVPSTVLVEEVVPGPEEKKASQPCLKSHSRKRPKRLRKVKFKTKPVATSAEEMRRRDGVTRRLTLSKEGFWEYLFSDRWEETCLLRVLEGELLDNLLAALYLLQKDHDVISYATIAYMENTYEKLPSSMKQPTVHLGTEIDPSEFDVEEVLVELDYFSPGEQRVVDTRGVPELPFEETEKFLFTETGNLAVGESEELHSDTAEELKERPQQDKRGDSSSGFSSEGLMDDSPSRSLLQESTRFQDPVSGEGTVPLSEADVVHASGQPVSSQLPALSSSMAETTSSSQVPVRSGSRAEFTMAALTKSMTSTPQHDSPCGEDRRDLCPVVGPGSCDQTKTQVCGHKCWSFPGIFKTTAIVSRPPKRTSFSFPGAFLCSHRRTSDIPSFPPLQASTAQEPSKEEKSSVIELPSIKCNIRGLIVPPPHSDCFQPFHMVREPFLARKKRENKDFGIQKLPQIPSGETAEYQETADTDAGGDNKEEEFEMVAEDPFLHLSDPEDETKAKSKSIVKAKPTAGLTSGKGTKSKPKPKTSDDSDSDEEADGHESKVDPARIKQLQNDVRHMVTELHLSRETTYNKYKALSVSPRLRKNLKLKKALRSQRPVKPQTDPVQTYLAEPSPSVSSSGDLECAKVKHWERCPSFKEFLEYLQDQEVIMAERRKKEKRQQRLKQQTSKSKVISTPKKADEMGKGTDEDDSKEGEKGKTKVKDLSKTKNKAKLKDKDEDKGKSKKKSRDEGGDKKQLFKKAGLADGKDKEEDWEGWIVSVRFAYLAGGVCDSVGVRNALLRYRERLLRMMEEEKKRREKREDLKSKEEAKPGKKKASTLDFGDALFTGGGQRSKDKKGGGKGQKDGGKGQKDGGKSKPSAKKAKRQDTPKSTGKSRKDGDRSDEDTSFSSLFDTKKLHHTYSLDRMSESRKELIGKKRYFKLVLLFEKNVRKSKKADSKATKEKQSKKEDVPQLEIEEQQSEPPRPATPPPPRPRPPMVLGKLREFDFLKYRDYESSGRCLLSPLSNDMDVEELRDRLVQAMKVFVVRKERATSSRQFKSRVSVTFTRRRTAGKSGNLILADSQRVVSGVCQTLTEPGCYRDAALLPC